MAQIKLVLKNKLCALCQTINSSVDLLAHKFGVGLSHGKDGFEIFSSNSRHTAANAGEGHQTMVRLVESLLTKL